MHRPPKRGQTITEPGYVTDAILKNTDHYIQHTSRLAEIEINMHDYPLVILSAYIPHDAANAEARVVAWDGLSARMGDFA